MSSNSSVVGQDHLFLVEKEWKKALPAVFKLKKIGAQKYFNEIENISDAFSLSDTDLRCIDEGTAGGLHLAGSGILLNINQAEEVCKKAQVSGIFSHAECGAARIYAKRENLDEEESDEFGIEWAKTIALKLKVPYKGHIEIEKMARPSGLHTAVAAYYDGTGQFDNSKIASLPKGFVIDRKYLDLDYGKTELKTAIEIAFGSHGFGNKFSEEMPFSVVVLAKDAETEKNLVAEAKDVVKEFGERVKVHSVLLK